MTYQPGRELNLTYEPQRGWFNFVLYSETPKLWGYSLDYSPNTPDGAVSRDAARVGGGGRLHASLLCVPSWRQSDAHGGGNGKLPERVRGGAVPSAVDRARAVGGR